MLAYSLIQESLRRTNSDDEEYSTLERSGVLLTAYTKEGELVTLIGAAREQILQSREKETFFCPICEEPLILKAGHVRIPHFSHRRFSPCTYVSTEPESRKHLKGKQDLYEWCKSHQLPVLLEHYLPEIKQRPDLLVRTEDRTYAIEFQCTPIPVKSVAKRTSRYLSAGITPVWILGGMPYHKKRNNQTFEWNEYYWSLSVKYDQNILLAGYEPDHEIFSLLTRVTPYTPRKVFGRLRQWPISQVDFPFCHFRDSSDIPLKNWLAEKRNWMQQKVRYGNLARDPFLEAVYTNKKNPFLLSPVIGIPVFYMESFISHPVEWQFFIWADCLKQINLNKNISLKYITYKLQTRIKKGELSLRILPMHERDQWKKAIAHYFQLLEQLFYFQQAGKDLYRSSAPFPWPSHVDQTGRMEADLFTALAKIQDKCLAGFSIQ
ncbi:competence protein CoiA [Siminovitchia sediminis]|uniref:Competence protein CoiA n=1 Tax=Siminovitchia sediminis TaxID=1274353 RepID=A0ABW4KHI9_9BACI